jgi:hypothetical protein
MEERESNTTKRQKENKKTGVSNTTCSNNYRDHLVLFQVATITVLLRDRHGLSDRKHGVLRDAGMNRI